MMDTPVDKSNPDTPLSSNRRIAKNTLMLYVRMLFGMLVALYTSRVVLNTLGVEDYGIYGVVGGVVSMFSFLNASMSGATSRFLTFEMGKGDFQRLKETFSSALMIHIGIALLVLLLAETVGLWFLNHKLVIPEERMSAAQWVYQLSILSMVVGVTQVPYNASIIAHEKMDVYAYVEILNVTLKLLIVYLLTVGAFDKLIFYAVLVFVVSVIVAFTYRIYCLRKFEECHFHWLWKPEILKPMMSFSGWDLYVNFCLTGRNQGVNILLNLFFGPLVNAAVSIGTSVQGVLSGFGENVLVALKPQIIKRYAKKDYIGMQKMISLSSSIASLCMGCVMIPVMLESKYIITLWLGECPSYCDTICNFCLLFSLIYFLFRPIVFALHAVGNIKYMGFLDGTIYLLVLPISVLYFKWGYEIVEIPFILNILFIIIAYSVVNVYLLKSYMKDFEVKEFLLNTIVKVVFVLFISFSFSFIFVRLFSEGVMRMFLVVITNLICLIFLSYYFVFDKEMKIIIKTELKKLIR